MVDRPDEHPRYFPDVAARIVGGAGIAVVSGTRYSGRSALLTQVAADLRADRVRVVHHRAVAGTLHPVEAPTGQYVVQAAKVAAAGLQVAGAGAVGNLLALAAEIATTRQLVDALDPERFPREEYAAVGAVERALLEEAGRGPLALVIDNADQLDRPEVWWDVLVASMLPRIVDRTGLRVVLAVERGSTVRSRALEVLDERLVPAGHAEEIRLPPLDAARIERAYGPVDPALLRQLRSLVQARPGWLDEVWSTWRADGAVRRVDGRWVAAPDARDRVALTLPGWVERTLHARVPDGDYWRAREILRTAALEGERFTVEALAAVLGGDVEDLVDWIDDNLADPDGAGLLDDAGFVARTPGVEPPELRRYRFRSPIVAGALRQEVLDGPGGTELARRYARALAAAYRWSPVSASAWTITRLAAAAGDDELAGTTWRRANRLESVESAAECAQHLLDHLAAGPVDPQEQAAVVDRLNGLLRLLIGRWNAARSLELARATAEAARAVEESRRTELLVVALQQHGVAAVRGGKQRDGIAALAQAAALSAGTDDRVRTADLYRLLANAEGTSTTDEEGLAIARRHAATALEHARHAVGPDAQQVLAICLGVSAQLADSNAEKVRAVGEAAGILLAQGRRIGGGSGTADVFMLLMQAADLAYREGDHAALARFRTAVTGCRGEVQLHVLNLTDLSAVHRWLGNTDGAVRAAAQALRLAQQVSRSEEGASLVRLASCARQTGRPVDAFVVLAGARLSDQDTNVAPVVADLRRAFGDVLAQHDEASRAGIDRAYRADGGAALLRDTFGIDVAEIDALNERLGGADEAELRGYLLDVQRYCTREAPT